MVLWEAGLSPPGGPVLLSGFSKSVQRVGCWGKDWRVACSRFAGHRAGSCTYQVRSHFIGRIFDTGHKGWTKVDVLCTQAEEEEELIFIKNTAHCLYHNHPPKKTKQKPQNQKNPKKQNPTTNPKNKKQTPLWRPQFLCMLSMLTCICFSADFGIKLLLLYLIKESLQVAWKAVTKTSITICSDLSVEITVITVRSGCKGNMKINEIIKLVWVCKSSINPGLIHPKNLPVLSDSL